MNGLIKSLSALKGIDKASSFVCSIELNHQQRPPLRPLPTDQHKWVFRFYISSMHLLCKMHFSGPHSASRHSNDVFWNLNLIAVCVCVCVAVATLIRLKIGCNSHRPTTTNRKRNNHIKHIYSVHKIITVRTPLSIRFNSICARGRESIAWIAHYISMLAYFSISQISERFIIPIRSKRNVTLNERNEFMKSLMKTNN